MSPGFPVFWVLSGSLFKNIFSFIKQQLGHFLQILIVKDKFIQSWFAPGVWSGTLPEFGSDGHSFPQGLRKHENHKECLKLFFVGWPNRCLSSRNMAQAKTKPYSFNIYYSVIAHTLNYTNFTFKERISLFSERSVHKTEEERAGDNGYKSQPWQGQESSKTQHCKCLRGKPANADMIFVQGSGRSTWLAVFIGHLSNQSVAYR